MKVKLQLPGEIYRFEPSEDTCSRCEGTLDSETVLGIFDIGMALQFCTLDCAKEYIAERRHKLVVVVLQGTMIPSRQQIEAELTEPNRKWPSSHKWLYLYGVESDES